MIQNVLRNMSGIEVFGVISILLFFASFVGVLIWAFTRKKSYIEAVSRLPLENDSPPLAHSSDSDNSDSRHE